MLRLFYQVKAFLLIVLFALILDYSGLFLKDSSLNLFHELDIVLGISIFVVLYFTIVINIARMATDILLFFAVTNSLEDGFKALDVLLNPLLHAGVPVVLDGVVCPSLQDVGDVGPFVGLVPIQYEQNPLFLTWPLWTFLNHGIQMVVPSLTALLTDAPRKMVCHVLPLLRTTVADQLEKELVLDFSPWPFNKVWI